MFSKAFPMYSQTMQMLYQRALYAFHEHQFTFISTTDSRASESQGGEMCFSILIRRFEGDDGRRRVLAGLFRGCAWKKSHKKSIEIHQPYAGSASCFTVCIPSLSFFTGNLLDAKLRDFSWPSMRAFSPGLSACPGHLSPDRSRHYCLVSISAQNKIQPRVSFTAKSRLTLALRFSMLPTRVKKIAFIRFATCVMRSDGTCDVNI